MRKIQSLSVLLIISITYAKAQRVSIDAIPFKLNFENKVDNYKAISENEIQFSSPPKSDLFYSADGKYRVNKSPRLLFKPDSCFTLSANINIEFDAN